MSSSRSRAEPSAAKGRTSPFLLESRSLHQRTIRKKFPLWFPVRYHFRRPKGAASYLIFLLMILFFSYQQNGIYKVMKLAHPNLDKLEPWQHVVVIVLIFEACPKLLYPFAGWLADAKFGRHKVLSAGVFITWISAMILLLVSVLSEVFTHFSIQVVAVLIYIVTATGTAFFHANLIPYGIDQMEDCSSEQISSFVHWYYWARNVNFGVVIQLAVSAVPSYCTHGGTESYDRWISLAEVSLLTLAVCLIFVFSKDLKTDPMIYNPIRKVKEITKYVIGHRRPLGYRRAHTYLPEHLPSRFDFAKKSFGGVFEEDDVEEVVTFWRFMVFLIPIGITSTLYFVCYYSLEPMFNHMARPTRMPCIVLYNLSSITPFMMYLISIPVYEFIICPLFRKYIPQMRVKMGMGILAFIIAFSYLLSVDVSAHINTNIVHNVTNFSSYQVCFLYNQTANYDNATYLTHLTFSPYTLVPFVVIFVTAELLVFLTVVEFICAQAPGSMRSFLISIYFFVYGISAILMSFLFIPFGFGFKNNLDHLQFSCGSAFFALAIVLGIVIFIIYFIIAKWYKNRQRGGQNDINYQTVVERYFEKLIEEREKRQEQSAASDRTTYYNL